MLVFLRMFTGIIKDLGIVVSLKKSGVNCVLRVRSNLRPTISASISINGVCTTVIKKSGADFEIDLMSETLKRTNLATLKPNDKVNLEPSLRLNDELGGHFVLGHIDGIGIIKSIKNNELWITASAELRKFIAFKGCIAINGVSLTISGVQGNDLKVSLIPYTLKHTNLGSLRKNDKVNLEIDMIARYLEKISHG